MERKLVKQGRNALTVTLPAKWLQHKGLKQGSSVFIEQRSKDLVITSSGAAARMTVELDCRGQERPMMSNTVMGGYIEGFDVITVLHDNPKAAQEIAQWFIGMVTEEQTAKKLVLKSIIIVPEDNFNALLRRAAHIFNQQARTLKDFVDGKATFDDVKQQEKLLDQNILYCLRYLSKYEHDKSHKQFLICATIEQAGDQISNIAKFIGKQKSLAELILKHVELYTKLLFTQDYKTLYTSLRSFRNCLGNKTFAEGLAYALAENLYNYIGYVLGEKDFKQKPLSQ